MLNFKFQDLPAWATGKIKHLITMPGGDEWGYQDAKGDWYAIPRANHPQKPWPDGHEVGDIYEEKK